MAKPRQSLAQSIGSSVIQKFISDPNSIQSSQTASIDQIYLPSRQPRRYFDAGKIQQLAHSIREHGILEPLLVRPLGAEKFELVAGERRLRAAQLVGLIEVPITIRDLDDKQSLQVALIENLQREDLNPIEETEAILDLLIIELGVDQQEVISLLNKAANAKKRSQELTENVFRQLEIVEEIFSSVGRLSPESFRVSRLPLLNLPNEILDALRQGKLEYTKAKAIAQVKDKAQQDELLTAAIQEDLSLSQIKERVAMVKAEGAKEPTPSLKTRFESAYQRAKKSKVWDSPKKQKALEKLLETLEKLADEE
ncbi:ParB/RepB/Spo0J family partition protein [Candidatus Woesearchaeota archaeon]|nr:ParB/RepB/Spo0J family partition protein [Candidatus Woesearchaeota archaeon]